MKMFASYVILNIHQISSSLYHLAWLEFCFIFQLKWVGLVLSITWFVKKTQEWTIAFAVCTCGGLLIPNLGGFLQRPRVMTFRNHYCRNVHNSVKSGYLKKLLLKCFWVKGRWIVALSELFWYSIVFLYRESIWSCLSFIQTKFCCKRYAVRFFVCIILLHV